MAVIEEVRGFAGDEDTRGVMGGVPAPREDEVLPWDTELGKTLLRFTERSGSCGPVLSLPSARLILRHALRGRESAHWDAADCERLVPEIWQRMTSKPEENLRYVHERIAGLGIARAASPSSRKAARAWVEDPADLFEQALFQSFASRGAVLLEKNRAFLVAVFVATLFAANLPPPVVLRTEDSSDMVPPPTVRRDRSRRRS